jgi:hypothetical protein
MNLEGQTEGDGDQDAQAHQLLNVTLLQGGNLPDHWAYLNGCSTVTAFKSNKYLSELEVMPTGIKINCNASSVTTKQMGKYGRMKVWYIPDGIANIISMHELEKLYQITYDSWEGYYVVYKARGQVHFHKDEQGLPYIDLEQSGRMAAIMLMQNASQQTMGSKGVALVQTVRENYEVCTKREDESKGGASRTSHDRKPEQRRLQGNGEEQHDQELLHHSF